MLAAAAAAVSFTAQYRMAETVRHLPAIAALEAAIPDAAALVFACLGIALALHGRRALRARTLNLAIWALPPVAYALASDTLIGVVRAWTLALHHHLGTTLAADAASPLAILGSLLLWLLRLALAPASILTGFRAWVLQECPVAPGRRARQLRPAASPHLRKATKTARFLDLMTERHGSLASIPRYQVTRKTIAPSYLVHDRRPGSPDDARTSLIHASCYRELRAPDGAAQVIAHAVSVPPGPRQQVLHPVRRGIPGLPGDRPAVLARQLSQQAQHERPRPPPRLPAETRADLDHQLIERPEPAVRVYAVASGHRKIVLSRHKP